MQAPAVQVVVVPIPGQSSALAHFSGGWTQRPLTQISPVGQKLFMSAQSKTQEPLSQTSP